MADLAGSLNIELKRLDGGVEAVIQSSRPVAASRVFEGKTVAETTTGIPALFSICAAAQASACASACEVAQGLLPSPGAVRLRQLLVDAETIKEHLWRMLLDWPGFFGAPPQAKAMQAVMKAYSELRTSLGAGADPFHPGADAVAPDLSVAKVCLAELVRVSSDHLLGSDPADWLWRVQTMEDLLRWAGDTSSPSANLVRGVEVKGWAEIGRNPVIALPPLSLPDLAPVLGGANAESFIAAPTWQDQPRESSPFTRRLEQPLIVELAAELGNGLLSRLAAQLVELAVLQLGLRMGLSRIDEAVEPIAVGMAGGVGIARVQAARGLLVHRVALDRGRIRDYRILAPTEWNFHPSGVVAQGLSTLPSADSATLARLASLFVTAVDPCVEYHVTVS